MNKYIKKIISGMLALSMFISTIITSNAATNVNVSVNINPKIDIMLTSKETSLDLNNFEEDIKRKLIENGINVDNIKFQTVERGMIDTKNNEPKTIFNTWTAFPYNKATNWKVLSDTNGSYLTSSDNETYETGFFDTTNGYVDNITMTSRVFCNQYAQPMGFIIRMTEDENDPNRYNYYCLSMTGYTGSNYSTPNAGSTTKSPTGLTTETPQRIFVLYKVEGMVFDYNIWKNTTQKGHTDLDVQYKTLGTWGATAWYCLKYKNQYVLGSPSTNYRNAGGWRDGTPLQVGITNVNMGDSNQKTTILGYSLQPLETKTGADWLDITITAKGTNIDINYDGKSIINVNDNSFTEGYYGVYQVTHVTPKYYGTIITTETFKNFKEILTEPTWREDAKHVVVNVDNAIDETLTSESTIGEILSRTLADDIHFVQWGTNTNKSASEMFISKNDNKGLFINNSNYNQAVEATVDYIISLVDQESSEQYITIGQDISFSVEPEEYKTNAKSDEYPNGRWKINHEYKYFANNLGQSSISGVPITDLEFNFDKPGKYNILFDDKLVKEIYVHRNPVADFEIGFNNDGTLNLISTSYDLDLNEDKGYGAGIAEENWYYKEASTSTWTVGKLTEFDKTKIYMIKLEVEDYQGATSYTTKYVGTGNPVSNFNYANNVVSKYKPLIINNTSYDPEGYEIIEYEWVLKKNGQPVSTTSEPITDFNQDGLGEGKYTYTLTVKNSKGTISEAFSKSFTIEEDYGKPEVAIGQQGCDWKTSQAVSLEFSDNESEFKNWRYAFTTSPVAPATDEEWSDWSNETESTVELSDVSGKYYLHIQAYDVASNELTRAVGTYNLDNTEPIINDVKTQKDEINKMFIKVEATDEHSGIVGYAITKAEPITFNLRTRFTATEPTDYQESNILEVTDNGTYNVWVKDSTGNVTVTTYTVEDVNYIGKNTTVYAEVGCEFKVTIPKHIILSGSTKSGNYTVAVEGDIAGTDVIKVIPDESFALSSTNLNDVTATIEQDKTEWSYDQILNDEFKIIGNGSIDAKDISAGSWNGNFNFNIVLEGDKVYKDSEPFVEYMDILYNYESE